MKSNTTFVRRGDHLGDAKMSKRAPRSTEFNFLLIAIDTNGFRTMKEEGQIYKTFASDFLIFAKGLSYGLSKFSDVFTWFFRL